MNGRNRKWTTILVGKLEGTKPLGRRRRRRDDNIKMILKGYGISLRMCNGFFCDRTGFSHGQMWKSLL
jgi:hypothetical protein